MNTVSKYFKGLFFPQTQTAQTGVSSKTKLITTIALVSLGAVALMGLMRRRNKGLSYEDGSVCCVAELPVKQIRQLPLRPKDLMDLMDQRDADLKNRKERGQSQREPTERERAFFSGVARCFAKTGLPPSGLDDLR